MHNPISDTEGNGYGKLLDETMYAAQLVSDSIDHFDDILKVAKMKHTPDYTRQLLSMEYEQLNKACRGLKDYEAKFKMHEGANESVLSFVKAMCRAFDEARDEYELFMKQTNGRV